MLKTLKDKWPLLALMGTGALAVGLVVGLLEATGAFEVKAPAVVNANANVEQLPEAVADSEVLGLIMQPPESRRAALSAIAQTEAGIESDRARYMLATDLINQGQGSQALPLLAQLENRYLDMAPYVLLRKGQAQAAAGQTAAAQATWNQLVSDYANSAAAAEALFQMGNQAANQAKLPAAAAPFWDTLLKEVPSHPRSVEIALKRLAETQPLSEANRDAASAVLVVDPAEADSTGLDDLSLLKLVAYYGINHPSYSAILDRLTSQYGEALTPADWAAIGFGYWENQVYTKAGEAYTKAPGTPTSQYRAARGKRAQRQNKRGDRHLSNAQPSVSRRARDRRRSAQAGESAA